MGMLSQEIVRNRFHAFSSGFLWIEQVMNKKKILGILMKQNLNKKIA